MAIETTIQQVDSTTFEFQKYLPQDENIIPSFNLDTVFVSDSDYVAINIYDENQILVKNYIESDNNHYSILNGDILLNPEQDLVQSNLDQGSYYINYNFFRKRLSSDQNTLFHISEISSDRTEIRLSSNQITNISVINSTNEFIKYRDSANYLVDFYLNFGDNNLIISNNIKLDTTQNNPTVLVKLYEPLPLIYDVKNTLWVAELISNPQTYFVTFPDNYSIINDYEYIKGPNFSLNIKDQISSTSQVLSYEGIFNSNVTSSQQQISNILNRKGIDINLNYEDFSKFVHFSSAKARLENFYYKASLIETYQGEISTFLGNITGSTTSSVAYNSSFHSLTSSINDIINGFDKYEYFLYYNSGSSYSWPKQNTQPPYQLYSTGSSQVNNWFTNVHESASLYDQNNQDWLYWTIPEYLRVDSENKNYEIFLDMVGQHFDSIWVYAENISNKFNADNRLSYGLSKTLVADAIRDFGVKLYSNNFNINDLYTSFLGITPSGSLFPFPDITGTLPAPTGYEYINTKVSSSNNNIIPLDDLNKSIYKRIYHNLPYLLKTKGTITGLRALINIYGIPNTILRVNEFGGKDRNNSNDWDFQQDIFNYAFDTQNGTQYLNTGFTANSNFGTNLPSTIQFRFKTNGIPTNFSQSLFTSLSSGSIISNILLEYNNSGSISGSYSGSISSLENNYGTIKYIPDISLPNLSAIVYLPVFNNEWWNLQASLDRYASGEATITVANSIDGKIGFIGNGSVTYHSWSFAELDESYLSYPTSSTVDSKTYTPFKGQFQELRYYNTIINSGSFYDYVLNPLSCEGNSINSTPNELYFRAPLGSTLDLNSISSIHPKVTGSWIHTLSFFDGTVIFATTLHPRWNDSEDAAIYGTDRFGFGALPSGYKDNVGFCFRLGNVSLLWNSTEYNSDSVWAYGTQVDSSTILRGNEIGLKFLGFAIRAIRPATTEDQLLPDGLISATYPDYDGNIYQCTKIGLQVWTTSNLKTTHYVDGTVIPTNLSDVAWAADTVGAMAVYGKNDGAYVPTDELTTEALMVAAYGRLYNWYAVNNTSGLIDPTDGWIVPADTDFTQLTDYLIATYPEITIDNVGDVLKSTRQVNSPYVVYGRGNSFTLSSGSFVENRETIYYNQPVVGIKNIITDKINIENMVLPEGDTLSPFRSIQQNSFISSSYSPNVNYLEVAFSPSDQINEDIMSQIGYLNIGDYIGDPRQINDNGNIYPDLDKLRNDFFKKYEHNYNVNDFIRLIKYFDNSLFKMLKDFVPAKTDLATGIIIKQHLLERNKQKPVQLSYEDVTYTSSIKNLPNNYEEGAKLYTTEGGSGGSFSHISADNQQWSQSIHFPYKPTSSAENTIKIADNREFYNGELPGSSLYTQMTEHCQQYKTGSIDGFDHDFDCQPNFNNVEEARQNPNLQDIDYSVGIDVPVNIEQLTSGSATRGSVPESNYTLRRHKLPRYDGSKVSSDGVNLNTGLIGAYDKYPPVESKKTHFAYISEIKDPYPVVNNTTNLFVKYIIDTETNIDNPGLSDITFYNMENVFIPNETINASFIVPKQEQQFIKLNGSQNISHIGEVAVPILYSQTASNGWASLIPLSASNQNSSTQNIINYGETAYENNMSNLFTPNTGSFYIDAVRVTSSRVFFDPDTVPTSSYPILDSGIVSGSNLNSDYSISWIVMIPSTVPQTTISYTPILVTLHYSDGATYTGSCGHTVFNRTYWVTIPSIVTSTLTINIGGEFNQWTIYCTNALIVINQNLTISIGNTTSDSFQITSVNYIVGAGISSVTPLHDSTYQYNH